MSLPLLLPVGTVSIYNAGASTTGVFAPTMNDYIRFGVVEQSYNQFGAVNIGSSVMFDLRDSIPLDYLDQNYWVVPENKLGAIETPAL